MFKIQTDGNLQEVFEYPRAQFPFISWKDDYENIADFTLGAHWHSDFEFAILVSGELDYYISETHLRLRAGDCMFINANTLHMSKKASVEPTVMIGITFRPSIIYQNCESYMFQTFFLPILNSQVQGVQIDTNNMYGEKIKETVLELTMTNTDADGYELLVLSALSHLWYQMIFYWEKEQSRFIRKDSNMQSETDIKKMIFFIKNNYMNNISIEDLTKYANVSRTECFRLFKRFTGKTPIEYLIDYRLTSAANLLCATEEKATSICMRCGFSNASYFGKLFKEKFGVSPLIYRKNLSN